LLFASRNKKSTKKLHRFPPGFGQLYSLAVAGGAPKLPVKRVYTGEEILAWLKTAYPECDPARRGDTVPA
jgi:hypothetical protein